MADAVTEAHLRGVETHGLRRLRPYIERIRSGGVDAAARPQVGAKNALLIVDGRNGIGHHVATVAAKAVSDAARRFGIAVALVRNSNHFGFAGHYATMIAAERQLALVTSNGQVCVAPEGGTQSLLSNNPLAIAAPMRADRFLELDWRRARRRARISSRRRARANCCRRAGRRTRRAGRPATRQRRSPAACSPSAAARASACSSRSRR